jgi:hypothetical protein
MCWCTHVVQRNGSFSLLCLKLATDCEGLAAFKEHVTGLKKMNCYILSQIDDVDKAPLYSDMSPNCTANDVGTKPVVIRT